MDPWTKAYAPDISPSVYKISCIYLACIGIFGILLNAYIIIIYLKNVKLRTPFNAILMNVVYAELISAGYGIPVDFAAAYYQGWKFGKTLCFFTGFVLTTSGMVSVFTLTYMSIHRYLCVFRPFTISIFEMYSHVIIAVIWFLAFVISVPPVVGWSEYHPEPSGMSCAPSWDETSSNSYHYFILILGFIIPCLIFVFSSASLLVSPKDNFQQRRSRRQTAQKRISHVNRMVFLMILSFNVTWFPYAALSLYKVTQGSVPPILTVFPVQFAKSGVCSNPIIYIIMSKEIRKYITPKRTGMRPQAHLSEHNAKINKNNQGQRFRCTYV